MTTFDKEFFYELIDLQKFFFSKMVGNNFFFKFFHFNLLKGIFICHFYFFTLSPIYNENSISFHHVAFVLLIMVTSFILD